jgi:tetratricopeptide (TPR) repeat protein
VTHPREYKPTLFDRHGPAAAHYLQAAAYGAMVAGLSMLALALEGVFSVWTMCASVAAGVGVFAAAVGASRIVGATWKRFAVDGRSTPYKEQYSREQALVMQGRIDDALASFEAVIAGDAAAVTARIRAAELYDRERGNAARAAELFREAENVPSCSTGERVYIAHRLVDLYTGPLGQPRRALVELRRLIDQFPDHPAANQAREALTVLKARYQSEQI